MEQVLSDGCSHQHPCIVSTSLRAACVELAASIHVRFEKRLLALLTLVLVFIASPSSAQQYRFSAGPWVVKVEGKGQFGRLVKHQTFPGLNVYCFDLPDSMVVDTMTFGLLNGNAITFADYPDPSNQLTAFIVTSTLPQGRTPDADYETLLATDRNSEKAIGDRRRFAVDTGTSAWGPTIQIRMRNVAASTKDGWFPLTRGLYENGDGPPHTRSTHRLFMRGTNRFEVAVVGNPKKPGDETSEAEALASIEELADQITESLQRCTTTEIHNLKSEEETSDQEQGSP